MSRSYPFALLVALSAWAGLILGYVDVASGRTPVGAVWHLLRYFTIWTNLVVALTFTRIVLTGRPASAAWSGGVALWIGIVGAVYHLLLAREGLTGVDWWSDLFQHTATPILGVAYWLLFAPKGGLRVGTAAGWMIFPAVYCVYALARGLLDGRFPYFFVNPDRIGWDGVAMWTVTFCGAFFLAGCAMVLLARALR